MSLRANQRLGQRHHIAVAPHRFTELQPERGQEFAQILLKPLELHLRLTFLDLDIGQPGAQFIRQRPGEFQPFSQGVHLFLTLAQETAGPVDLGVGIDARQIAGLVAHHRREFQQLRFQIYKLGMAAQHLHPLADRFELYRHAEHPGAVGGMGVAIGGNANRLGHLGPVHRQIGQRPAGKFCRNQLFALWPD